MLGKFRFFHTSQNPYCIRLFVWPTKLLVLSINEHAKISSEIFIRRHPIADVSLQYPPPPLLTLLHSCTRSFTCSFSTSAGFWKRARGDWMWYEMFWILLFLRKLNWLPVKSQYNDPPPPRCYQLSLRLSLNEASGQLVFTHIWSYWVCAYHY